MRRLIVAPQSCVSLLGAIALSGIARRGAQETSLGPVFMLLTAPEGGAWHTAAAQVARELNIRIDAYTIGEAGADDRGDFVEAYGLAAGGAVLIGPDGHVAWRSPSGPLARTELSDVLRRILAR